MNWRLAVAAAVAIVVPLAPAGGCPNPSQPVDGGGQDQDFTRSTVTNKTNSRSGDYYLELDDGQGHGLRVSVSRAVWDDCSVGQVYYGLGCE